jgi:hypothetical protein
MSKTSWLPLGALAVALIACAWLYIDNRALRRELVQSRGRGAGAESGDSAAPKDGDGQAAASPSRPGSPLGSALRSRLGFAAGAERPSLPAPSEEKDTRAERRQRRQVEIAAMFGRLDGESAEDYRERMQPFVKMSLAGPRSRLEDARRAAEQAAGVTGEQRAALDSVLGDAYQEAVELTNRALATGDLTPYSRNWSGVLNLAGGMGAILEGAESRIGSILTPEQVRAMYDQGFEWGEYLGVTAPWEDLDPPPPGG